MGLSGGLEPSNLTTVMKHHKTTSVGSHESVKLGIDAQELCQRLDQQGQEKE